MATFEERFAAVGRAIDGVVDRFRRGRAPRAYRSPRSRRSMKDRMASWRVSLGERASELRPRLTGLRRGMGSAGSGRLNSAAILGAMALAAGAMWLWMRTHALSLSHEEVQALSSLSKTPPGAPAAGAGSGAWWNQATTKPK